MTRIFRLFCSILGTSLALLVAGALVTTPASAQKKKKAQQEEPAAQAEGGGSLDDLMNTAATDKKQNKKATAPAADEPEEDAYVEPDSWERPPMEEKAPAREKAAPVEEPHGDGKPISVGLLLGYGFKTDRQTSGLGSDPYTFAAGLRGGYMLDFGLYLGGYFHYYLGSSTEALSAVGAGFKETSASYMHFGAEVGYDWFAGPVIIRPSIQLGLGIAFTDAQGSTRSVSDFMIGPGVTVMYPVDMYFIGGDMRGAIVTADGVSAVLLGVIGGLRFE